MIHLLLLFENYAASMPARLLATAVIRDVIAYEDNGIKYREYRALRDFQALQRTDQGGKLATRPYIFQALPLKAHLRLRQGLPHLFRASSLYLQGSLR
jgi:hypothetical protein